VNEAGWKKNRSEALRSLPQDVRSLYPIDPETGLPMTAAPAAPAARAPAGGEDALGAALTPDQGQAFMGMGTQRAQPIPQDPDDADDAALQVSDPEYARLRQDPRFNWRAAVRANRAESQIKTEPLAP
jgi:hypothetical protein